MQYCVQKYRVVTWAIFLLASNEILKVLLYKFSLSKSTLVSTFVQGFLNGLRSYERRPDYGDRDSSSRSSRRRRSRSRSRDRHERRDRDRDRDQPDRDREKERERGEREPERERDRERERVG